MIHYPYDKIKAPYYGGQKPTYPLNLISSAFSLCASHTDLSLVPSLHQIVCPFCQVVSTNGPSLIFQTKTDLKLAHS